jgi:hemerythrin superfamily protein
MDAITVLKNDHKTVNELFKKFEKAGDNAHKTKAKLVEQIIHELAVHAAVEEVAFYPFIKGVSPDLTDDVLESLEEHHVVKWLLSELEGMSPKDERFDAKVTVLIESVRHHVKDEEQEMFPRIRQMLSRSDLQDLGEALTKAKKVAPTHPHPKAPDEPPFNVIASVVSGLIDRAHDTGREAVKRSTSGRRRPASRSTSRRNVATRASSRR